MSIALLLGTDIAKQVFKPIKNVIKKTINFAFFMKKCYNKYVFLKLLKELFKYKKNIIIY